MIGQPDLPPTPSRNGESRSRFPAQIGWLKARLSPEGDLGLHLTLGALALIVMAWLFGHIAEDVVTREPIVLLDQKISEWFQAHGTVTFFRFMSVITFFGSGIWLSFASVLGAALFVRQRAWSRLLVLLLAVPGGGLLNLLLKMAFQRERPVWEQPLFVLQSYSFPSGHTMGATLLYGVAMVWGFSGVRTRRGRRWILVAGTVTIFLVGFSRVALGVHFLSDVLGAIAAGLAWLALCVTAVETLRRRQRTRA